MKANSPEDQAILEASFLHNPKPDKAARMALVDKVALGEKEVQVLESESSIHGQPLTSMADMVSEPPPKHATEATTIRGSRDTRIGLRRSLQLTIWRVRRTTSTAREQHRP